MSNLIRREFSTFSAHFTKMLQLNRAESIANTSVQHKKN